jgi:hypothetical protein
MPPASGDRRRLPQSRPAIVGLGVLLGAAWGFVMWGLTTLLGQESGTRGLVYLVVTIAMLGGGVAAFFGIFQVRGERDAAPRTKDRR